MSKAVDRQMPKLKKVYKKIAKERKNAATRGRPGHVDDAESDTGELL